MTFRDDFETISFSNSDGTADWASDWVKIGEDGGPSSGHIKIKTYMNRPVLRIRKHGRGAQRTVDLSGTSYALLSFDYARKYLDDLDDYVALKISGDGGGSWTELARFTGPVTPCAWRDWAPTWAGYSL